MDNKLLNFSPEDFSSWLFDETLCKDLQLIREQNYKKLLKIDSFLTDIDLTKFIDLNIDLQDYNYSILNNNIKNLKFGVWQNSLNQVYAQKQIANIIESQVFNDHTNNIDLFVKTLWNNSLVIFIPANTYVKDLINIKEKLIDSKQIIIKKLIIIVEENSKVEIEQNIELNNFLIESICIIAGPNSIVKLYRNHKNTGHSISNINCYLNKDSKVDILDCSYNSSFYLNYVNLILKEPNSQANYTNLSNISNSNTQAIITNQLHKASFTESKVLVKSLLQNQAQAFYKGLIDIGKKANNSNSDQKNLNLVLDNSTKVCSIPALQVKNNNVKCSHGSAIGKLDKEQLWYLNSKGLEKRLAKKVIVEGFFNSGFDYNYKNYINKLIKCL